MSPTLPCRASRYLIIYPTLDTFSRPSCLSVLMLKVPSSLVTAPAMKAESARLTSTTLANGIGWDCSSMIRPVIFCAIANVAADSIVSRSKNRLCFFIFLMFLTLIFSNRVWLMVSCLYKSPVPLHSDMQVRLVPASSPRFEMSSCAKFCYPPHPKSC